MKKLLSVLFASALIMGLTTTAFATNIEVATYTGLIPDSGRATTQPLTNEQLAFQAEKQAFFESLGNTPLGLNSKSSATRAGATWKYLSGGFTCFSQSQSNYCGPATVYNTLYKLNGTSPNQLSIANSIGTTASGSTLVNMVNYINSRISTRSYDRKYGVNKTDMINYLYSGLCYEMPPIIGIACTAAAGWPYTTGGHALNINGCTTDGATFNLADPLIGYLGLTGAFHDKTSTQLYNAYNAINAGLAW